MTDRKLTISFGTAASPSVISSVRELEWQEFAAWLTKRPPVMADKAARGWYCPVEFRPAYRDSDNFIGRHAITFDFDHVERAVAGQVFAVWSDLAFAFYTTYSHTAESPRFRVVLPLSRPALYDEYQAVVRKIACDIGIENFARESFTPAQMMFAPTLKAEDAQFVGKINEGKWLDVDEVLAEYENWTDKSQWPHRRDGDGVHKIGDQVPPDEKPGIVGDFCRAFLVPDAIRRFELPYTPTTTEGRWTYTNGSRPEGAIEYDDGLKFHSHHDTDPARGQNNAFDLVRLHKYGDQDSDVDLDLPVTARPSYRAMCDLALAQPEVQAVRGSDFEDLGPLTEPEQIEHGAEGLARRICDVLAMPTAPDWLIQDTVERGVIGILAGPRGSYKSFIALDWSMRIATRDNAEPVYVISAEGGDFDRRAAAWLKHFMPTRSPDTVPLYVVERRLDLSTREGVERIRKDCQDLNIRPSLFVLDTFSKLSGGLEENDNSEVKQFIGMLDNGLKRVDTGFGATVLLVAHTGHSDASRARGASALAADTDAEYIASRNLGLNSVNVSRERFKSSPELPPLCYEPKVIDLGRTDRGGAAVTSLVMTVTTPPVAGNRGARGANQVLVVKELKKMAPSGESVHREDLAKAAAKMLPKTGKDKDRDRREEVAEKAITALLAGEVLHLHGEDRVSLTPARVLRSDEWE